MREVNKRDRTPKAEATRAQILHAALELFKAEGYERATMRKIAAHAQVATGAAYYYFRTKDELVLAFYEETQEEAERYNQSVIAQSTDFNKRVKEILSFKFSQLAPYRAFIDVLAKSAADPQSPLSPFSTETRSIRDRSIVLFEQAAADSNLKIASMLRPQLPRLLWFYQMGLIFFWIHDSSPGQQRTGKLLEHSLKIIMRLIRLSTIPLMRPVNRGVLDLLQMIDLEEA